MVRAVVYGYSSLFMQCSSNHKMERQSESSAHKRIKTEIVAACFDLGYLATEEYWSRRWRADVLAASESDRIAFEVQLSSQSLKKTLERQERFAQDGVRGCWLFQKPISKLLGERPDLPLFYVAADPENNLMVSLSNRKVVPLHNFVKKFLASQIKFCKTARTKPEQTVTVVFYEMPCWKCQAMNHIYYVDTAFRASCNAVIEPDEYLWGSNRQEYRLEIVDVVREFLITEQGQHLHLGEIKPRHSKTVGDTYMSFGCYQCDSIFGDWFVSESKMEAVYGYGQVATIERTIRLQEAVSVAIPHWCYADGQPFCDEDDVCTS